MLGCENYFPVGPKTKKCFAIVLISKIKHIDSLITYLEISVHEEKSFSCKLIFVHKPIFFEHTNLRSLALPRNAHILWSLTGDTNLFNQKARKNCERK